MKSSRLTLINVYLTFQIIYCMIAHNDENFTFILLNIPHLTTNPLTISQDPERKILKICLRRTEEPPH